MAVDARNYLDWISNLVCFVQVIFSACRQVKRVYPVGSNPDSLALPTSRATDRPQTSAFAKVRVRERRGGSPPITVCWLFHNIPR